MAGGDIHEAGAVHSATIGARAENFGKIMNAGGREGEAIVRAIEARAISNGGHFDCCLCTVGEGIIHFRVEIALGDLFCGPTEEAPHGVRCGVPVARFEIHTFTGRGYFEARCARPIDKFADQSGLIAIGH